MNILEQAKNEKFVKEQFIKGRILDDTKDYGRTQFVDEIYKLQQENKQLKDNIRQMDNSVDKLQKQLIKEKDNWNKLRKYIKETKLKEFEKDYGKRYGKTFTQAEIVVCNMILDKMLELKKGSDNNE